MTDDLKRFWKETVTTWTILYSSDCLGRLSKITKTFNIVTDILASIRTEYLSDASQGRSRYVSKLRIIVLF
jgi:hypothetical protein